MNDGQEQAAGGDKLALFSVVFADDTRQGACNGCVLYLSADQTDGSLCRVDILRAIAVGEYPVLVPQLFKALYRSPVQRFGPVFFMI